LFRSEGGHEPFIGVIVNPYDRERLSNQSKIRFFMVGPVYQDGAHYRKSSKQRLLTEIIDVCAGTPYRLLETSQHEELDEAAIKQLIQQAEKVISEFANHVK
jgi:hypothetical protein